jgi:hypothetical protein
MGGICNTHGEIRNIYKILVVKPDGKIPFKEHMRRWEDNIKIYLQNST